MDANWPKQVPREAQDRRHGPRWFSNQYNKVSKLRSSLILFLFYFCFPSFFFPLRFHLEKKALVKYLLCIVIVRFSLLYSNYQTLSYSSICQTSLPLYYLLYTSPCITLVTSFPCIILVYDLSNASSCKTLVKCRP